MYKQMDLDLKEWKSCSNKEKNNLIKNYDLLEEKTKTMKTDS